MKNPRLVNILQADNIVPSPISVFELQIWALLVVGSAYWGNVIRTGRGTEAMGPSLILENVLQNGAFCVAAWGLIAALVQATSSEERASGRQIAATIGLCLLSAVPARQATILALIALAAQFGTQSSARPGRSVAVLLLALAIDMAWTSIYALPLHTNVSVLDARAVQAVAALAGFTVAAHGNVATNVDTGFGIEILARCTSSHPLAGVLLAFAVTLLYRREFPRSHDFTWMAMSFIASIVLSEMRLTWMVLREEDFDWLHEGSGVTVFALVGVGLAVLFPLLARRKSGLVPIRR